MLELRGNNTNWLTCNIGEQPLTYDNNREEQRYRLRPTESLKSRIVSIDFIYVLLLSFITQFIVGYLEETTAIFI